MKFDYGGAWERHPIETGTAVFPDGSRLKVHDIMYPLPTWIYDADVLFTDSPWTTGNLRSFYTKAEIAPEYLLDFKTFYARLFECIAEIRPRMCWLEIGKDFLADYIMQTRRLYKYVTFFNSTYYHHPDNHCYVVLGSDKSPRGIHLDGMDEEDIISWVAANTGNDCMGDLCMGQGLVALAAYKNGRKFVGTELNHKRLSVTLERLSGQGAQYTKED